VEKSLYVIAHKVLENKMPNGRKVMLVGAFNKEVPKNYFSDFDKERENISDKNYSFCELTGFYYFTKHDNASVLGLEHYRRFFVSNRLHLFKYHYLTSRHIDKILKKYDVILPKISKLKTSVKEQYQNDHYMDDLIELRNVIADLYPKYLEDFDLTIDGDKVYFCNMIIGKSSVVKSYSKWLFDILLELEKRIDISDRDAYQKRVFGFLSERLMLVYFKHNKNYKIKEKHVLLVDHKKPIMHQLNRVKRKIKSIFHINK